jgi:hypothetical protein
VTGRLGVHLVVAQLLIGGCGGGALVDAAVPASDAGPDAARTAVDADTPADTAIDAARVERDAAIEIDAAPDAWAAPTLTLEPGSLEFGAVLLGTSSSSQTVRVTSSGPSTSGVLGVLLMGPDARAFVVPRDTCSGRSLVPSSSCEIDVALRPTAGGGDVVASLYVTMTSGTMASVSLSERVVVAIDAVVEPSFADLGSATVGTSTEATTSTLRNSGTEPSGVVTVTLTGPNPGDFVLDDATSTCPGAPVPAMGACTTRVSFRPTAAGGRSATLRASAAPGGIATAALTGTGSSP